MVSQHNKIRRAEGLVFFVLAAVFSLAACGGGGATTETLAPLPTSPTTTLPTTLPPMTTTTSTTVSSSTSSTSTTVSPAETLVLRSDGLGDSLFGVDAAALIAIVTELLGKPDSDSGYVPTTKKFKLCPGTKVRSVRWGDLMLMFGDESGYAEGRLHFFSWNYGPVEGIAPVPMGPTTDGDITLGSTVAELLRVYPSAEIFMDDVAGASFSLENTLSGILSDQTPNGVVIAMYGGNACVQ
jgi:hypothetical protein